MQMPGNPAGPRHALGRTQCWEPVALLSRGTKSSVNGKRSTLSSESTCGRLCSVLPGSGTLSRKLDTTFPKPGGPRHLRAVSKGQTKAAVPAKQAVIHTWGSDVIGLLLK